MTHEYGGRHGRLSRAFALLTGLLVAATMVLAIAPPASAATASTSLKVKVWHRPRLTKLVTMARKITKMHIPYSHGGHGSKPSRIGASVDCSGLVRQLCSYAFGVDIGRGNGDSMVRTSGRFVKTSHPVPGDVVLVGHHGHAPAYHAMIYVGNDDGHPTGVGSPDFGYTVEYQHPWTRYWAGDVMGYWHFKDADGLDSAESMTAPRVMVTLGKAYSGHGTVVIIGHASDPVNPTRSLAVDVYISGKKVARIKTDSKNHRLSAHIRTRSGSHAVRLKAYHVAGDRVPDAKSNQRRVIVRRQTSVSGARQMLQPRNDLHVRPYGSTSARWSMIPRSQQDPPSLAA